ncbi:hypothetical protein K461DRAFT_274798 [Myriangium duriaei CBS 260.36]|uniref:Uncharacterized protein n=1 Tax=Myriangium duriaei CBS 260.36 TaxID=1168546 RepID=A0A9P4J985_9PEZI|nr:hypothetical protein K461DRAFT_274798 [Myriangium duriaei CBS 260.36]
MVRRVVGTAAVASALTANALLIPPGVQSVKDAVKIELINSDWQAVSLPCPDCVIPSSRNSEIKEEAEGDAPVFIQGGSNSLLVNVTTLFGGNAIGLPGDVPLYPPLPSFNKATVDIVPSEASMVQLQATSDRRYTVPISSDSTLVSEETVTPDGDAVIRIKHHIASVDNHPVSVDAVEITCLKNKDGKMLLINAERVPSPTTIFDSLPPAMHGGELTPPPPPPHGKAPCSLPPLLCQWRDFVEAKMSALSHGMHKGFGGPRPCHGGKGRGKGKGMHKGPHRGPHMGHKGQKGPWRDEEGTMHLPTHNRPGRLPHFVDDDHHSEGHGVMSGRPHHGPHGHHGGFWAHHRHHHMPFHGLVRGFLMVLIPIFLGITMGMTVSLIGMIVGRLIAFLWMRFVRGGERGYASVRLSEEEAENAEANKEELDEPLPLYEDAPAYEEKAPEAK